MPSTDCAPTGWCTSATARGARSARPPRHRRARRRGSVSRVPAAGSATASVRHIDVPAAARRCGCSATAEPSRSTTNCAVDRADGSTMSCCSATMACLPTTSPSSSTMPPRGSPTWSAVTTCWPRRRSQIALHRLLGLPMPRYAHVPLVLAPDGARLAKRHGAVTLGRPGCSRVLTRRRVRTAGRQPRHRHRSAEPFWPGICSSDFDPQTMPRTPWRLAPRGSLTRSWDVRRSAASVRVSRRHRRAHRCHRSRPGCAGRAVLDAAVLRDRRRAPPRRSAPSSLKPMIPYQVTRCRWR